MIKEEEKRKRLREILPLVWNSYQHMYDVRIRNTQNSISFLLIVISFLPIISLMLMDYFHNLIFLIPISFQLLAFLILISTFFVKTPGVHWIRIVDNDVLNEISQKEFDINLVASLKSIENMTWVYLIEMKKIIRFTLCTILISSYSLILAIIFIYFVGALLYMWIIILTFLFFLIFICGKNKLDYKYDSDFRKFKKQIEEWLKE